MSQDHNNGDSDEAPHSSSEELFRRYYGAVYSVFIRLGLSTEDACDLAQETFFRVCRGMEHYRGESQWNFLLKVAKRVASNEFRRLKARKRKVQSTSLEGLNQPPKIDEHHPMARDTPSPEEKVLSQEIMKQLHEATKELRPEYRQCLIMNLRGDTSKEIAAVLKVDPVTVRDWTRKAKKKLRNKLAE